LFKCGLTQKKAAELFGVSLITNQRICQGTLGLSEEFAMKMEKELDVSAAWILANDDEAPIVTPRGGLWSKELYEFVQGSAYFAPEGKTARTVPKDASDEFIAWRLTRFCARVHAMLETTRNTPRQGILVHRLNKMLADLAEDFKPDPATFERYQPRIDKLEEAYFTAVNEIDRKETEELRDPPRDSDSPA
jgi:transcriptional regulator with XRE-family HTH domain